MYSSAHASPRETCDRLSNPLQEDLPMRDEVALSPRVAPPVAVTMSHETQGKVSVDLAGDRVDTGSSIEGSKGACKDAPDFVDISISDDEEDSDDRRSESESKRRNDGSAGIVSEVLLTRGGVDNGSTISSPPPPPSGTGDVAGPTSKSSTSTSPRRVVSWRSPTLSRSLFLAGPGSTADGALDWNTRPCTAWLERELQAGAIKASGTYFEFWGAS